MMRPVHLGRGTAFLAVALLLASCHTDDSRRVYKSTRLLMGTIVEVMVVAPRDKAKAATEAVFDELKRVESLASFHKASALTAVNQAAGTGPVHASSELLALIKHSLDFAARTNGAFDPTLGPVSQLWNFSGEGEARVPAKGEIREALKRTGWQKVTVDLSAGTISLAEKGMSLDLGGIAKGYALDRARLVLRKLGVTRALVNAGGDIIALGEKAPGKLWRVGVQDPRNSTGIAAVAAVKDKCVLTSGDYERFIEKDGVRYHHILDPRTGYPTRGIVGDCDSRRRGHGTSLGKSSVRHGTGSRTKIPGIHTRSGSAHHRFRGEAIHDSGRSHLF
jgi:thiamine biosynthesis lipoprotein